MGQVNTKQIIVFLLVASFFLSCSKNIKTTPKKSIDEFLEKQKLSSKLDPEEALFKEAYEFYKKAKQSAKYPINFDDYGTEDLKSVEFLEQAVAINPYYHAAYYVLGLCYSKTENYKKAEKCFLKSIKLKPKNQDGYTKLADIYKKQNRLDEALYYYDESLKLGPPDGDILSNIGEIYLLKGDLEKAEIFYLRILNLEKGKEFYLDNVASFYLKKGNLKESWKYLKRSNIIFWADGKLEKQLEAYKEYLSKDNFYAHASVGFIHYFCGNYKRAIEHFEKALNLNRNEFDQYYLLGMSYRGIYNYEKTVLYLEEALKSDPNHYDSNMQLGMIYGFSTSFVDWYKTKVDYERSVELLEKAKQINPENQNPYFYLGRTYLKMKNYYNALIETRKALNIEKDAVTLSQMGEIYYEMKDYKMALQYYSESLELDDNFVTRFYIIEALVNLKDYDKAKDFIKKSIDADPDNNFFILTLGDVFFEEGKYLAAIKHYEDYLKKEDSNNSHAHFNIALSYLRLKNWLESGIWWKKTIELDPKQSAAFYNLGYVYLNTSLYEKALINFKRALELYPEDNETKVMIETCQRQIDFEKLPEKLRKLSLRNDNIGNLSSVLLCTIDYDNANNLWIDGVKETEYKDGENIVSPKIFEAQGHFEKIKIDLNKISSPKGQIKKIIDLFLFAVSQRIKGIEQHSEGFYTTKGDYKGQYEKGRAKIRIADNYYVDCLKSLRDEINKNKSIFGDIADEKLKSSIEYYENKYKK